MVEKSCNGELSSNELPVEEAFEAGILDGGKPVSPMPVNPGQDKASSLPRFGVMGLAEALFPSARPFL